MCSEATRRPPGSVLTRCIAASYGALTDSHPLEGELADRGRDLVGPLDHRQVPRVRQHQEPRGGQRGREPRPAGGIDHLILLAEDDEGGDLQPVDAVAQALVHDRGARGSGRASRARAERQLAHRAARRAPTGRRPVARRRARRSRLERASSGAATPASSRDARCTSGSRHERRTSPVAIRPAGASRATARTLGRMRERMHDRDASAHRVTGDDVACDPELGERRREALGHLGQREPAARKRRRAAEARKIHRDHAELRRESLADRAPRLPGGAEAVQAHERRGRLVARKGDIEVGYPPLMEAAKRPIARSDQLRGRCRRGPRSPPRSPPPPAGARGDRHPGRRSGTPRGSGSRSPRG